MWFPKGTCLQSDYLTGGGWYWLGVGAWPSRAREGKENQGDVRREGAGTSSPSLLPLRHHGFSLWLAMSTMGREVARALWLHVKGVLMEGMCHVAGLGHTTAWRGLRASFLSIRMVSIFSSGSGSTSKYLNE